MKKINSLLIGVFALIVVVGSLSYILDDSTQFITGRVSHKESAKVTIGYRGHLLYLPAYVAKAEGYYEEEGLNVELIKFDSTNQLVEAVINDNVDAAIGGVNALVPLTIEGKEKGLIKIFSLGYWSKDFDGLLVRKDSDIKTLKDMNGKTLSTLPGSTAKLLMDIMLETENLDGKVNIVQTQASQQLSALASKSVDIIFVLEPTITIGETNNISRVLLESPYSNYLMDNMLWETSVFSTEFVNKKPELARKISNAVDKAIISIDLNQNRAKKYYSEFTPVDDSLESQLPITSYQTNSRMNIVEFQELTNELFEKGFLEKKISVESMFYKK